MLEVQENRRHKLELQELSRQKMANWSNTIHGIVAQRQREKAERFEREEHERRRLDLLEFELEKEKRQTAVDHATKVAQANMDHMKAFHSGMMMADVLKEREMQLKLKKRKQEHAKEMEIMWEQTEQEMLTVQDNMLKQRLIEEYKRKQETAATIKEQLHNAKMKAVKNYQDNVLEGKLIKRQAEEEEEEERVKA